MKAIQKNKTITSLELLKKINKLREKEYLEKVKAGILTEAERKRGKFSELRHKDLLKVIRNEFDEDFNGRKIYLSEDLNKNNEQKLFLVETKKDNEGKISPVKKRIQKNKILIDKYLDEKGERRNMYVLPLEKAKQVLMRESKYVRKAVIGYIEYLENQNRQLEELTRLQARELAKNEQIPFTLIYQEVRERTETKAKVLLKALQKIESVDNGPVWSLEYSENKGENSYE